MKDKILKLFLDEIKNKFKGHIKKIILFGSRARGDSSYESDYDILFIFDRITKREEEFIEDLASWILIEYGMMISTFVLDQKEFAQRQFEPFVINLQKEGILL